MARYATYAPEFIIRLAGNPLPPALRAAVASMSYEDGLQGADRVDITLANPALRWLDHPLLAVDTPFSLSIGYRTYPIAV